MRCQICDIVEGILLTNITVTLAGEANVLQSFTVTEGRQKVPVAGCRCVKGVMQKKLGFKLLRDGETLLDGECLSLSLIRFRTLLP